MVERSEREKMVAGELYNSFVPELVEDRLRARRLVREFNGATEEELERRDGVLRELFASMGKNVFIEPPFRCDYGTYIHVGDNFFANFGLIILDCAEVRIGNQVMFGPNVQLYAATHPLDAEVRTTQALEYGRPIAIGNKVWLGGSVIVLPGVSIGAGTVVGAGSVVTRSLPPGVVAAGNPAKILRVV